MSRVVTAQTVALLGLRGQRVSVEAHCAQGLPAITLVGLPDMALREAKDRVRAACASCGFLVGRKKLTVNLSPADLPKTGSSFDLAIAVSILWAEYGIDCRCLDSSYFYAELGLDGSLRPVKGVLPAAQAAMTNGCREIFVHSDNQTEAALVPGLKVRAFEHLSQVIYFLAEKASQLQKLASVNQKFPDFLQQVQTKYFSPSSKSKSLDVENAESSMCDLADVKGQTLARLGIELAAIGGHHLLMLGVPGAGKTMLAKCLPSIMPPMSRQQAISVTGVHSLAGPFSAQVGLMQQRPFIAPHHSASLPALVGGGSPIPKPGLISLAHQGVLFLDEAPEFSPRALDALRQPLESGKVQISRSRYTVEYPARFQLVMAANPCPCGNAMSRKQVCSCSVAMRRRYSQRLSGPLLDRIDIQVIVEPLTAKDLDGSYAPESSAVVAQRVNEARDRASFRLQNTSWEEMRQVPGSMLEDLGKGVPKNIMSALHASVTKGRLSMRGMERVLRVGWSAADLYGHTVPTLEDIGLAMSMRQQGKTYA